MSKGHSEFINELGAYLVGGLDSHEASEVRRHLESCPECRDVLRELDGIHELMEAAALTIQPPQELEVRILARIEGEAAAIRSGRDLSSKRSTQTPASRYVKGLAMAAIFLFILGVGLSFLLRPNSDTSAPSETQVGSAMPSPTSLAPLKLLSGSSGVGGELTPVAAGEMWECQISVWGLEKGRLYEVWIQGERGWISAGTFRVKSLERHDFRAVSGARIRSNSKIIVTLEADDGNAGPSDQIVLTGHH